jgi:hypothetical protein
MNLGKMVRLTNSLENLLLVVDGPVYELVMAALNELRPIAADMFYEFVREEKKKREWVGLTHEDILTLGADIVSFTYARAVEAKLKEKNHV